jgi:tRNA nucleotidyltransferase (CCA-adding enzyme)
MKQLTWLFEPEPHKALAILRASGELARILPEVDALYGVPQVAVYHPEVDTGIHIEMCLQVAEELQLSPAARFAVLMHDLGKALTPKEELPKHVDHEHRGIKPVERVCERLGAPLAFEKLALLVCERHLQCHIILQARSRTVVQFLNETGMEYDAALLADFTGACEADARGRGGALMAKQYKQRLFLLEARRALEPLPMPAGTTPESEVREVQDRHRARLNEIRSLMHKYVEPAAPVDVRT